MSIDPKPSPERPAMFLRAQYIKDLSFENPRAPGVLFNLRNAPAMEVAINLSAQKLDENLFELAIHISTRAKTEEENIFLCDVTYAGVLEMQNIPDDARQQAIFITGAQLIYPFARRVVADITRDGGFPAVQLEPVDFVGLYEQQRARAAQMQNPVATA